MHIPADTLFRALADLTRLRCLLLIREHRELCVCELTHALGEAQPKISRHLAQLREAGLVLDRRQGLWVHYRLHPELPEWVHGVLAATAEGAADSEFFAHDQNALTGMPNRPDRCA